MANTDMAVMLEQAKALQQSAQQATDGQDGCAFIKFTKFGEWVWGVEEAECEEDSQWIIHPQGFKHGYIAWGDKEHGNAGEKCGDILIPAFEPLPLRSSLEEVNANWNQQVSMQMMCVKGFDKGVKVIFNSSSLGGRKVYQKIVDAVVARIEEGEVDVAPVITLDVDSYPHKKHGKIFTPEVEIIDYLSLAEVNEMLAAKDDDEADEPKEEVKETKAKRTTAKKDPVKVDEQTSLAPDDKPVRQRRQRQART